MSKYISTFRRGDTKQIAVSRTGTDSSGSPVPVPFLAGSTLTFSLKSDIDQPQATLQVTHPVGSGPLDDLEAGVCIISLSSNQTAALEPGKFFWDIQLIEDTPFGLATTTLAPPPSDWKDRIEVVADVTV
jgi:hypothetical protein